MLALSSKFTRLHCSALNRDPFDLIERDFVASRARAFMRRHGQWLRRLYITSRY